VKKRAEGGRRQPGDGRRQKDELMGNRSKYHQTEADIYSIECRAGGGAGGPGGLEKLGEAIRPKS
jgi:hypothetical protein